ncbi:MAG: glucuronyl hydrolase [Paenibacillaceae bacterium]|nr:glucuronyl hydrolase [Paenibacillaceae bacterium]
MEHIWQKEIELIIGTIDQNMKKFGSRFPHIHREGIYSESFSADGSWTGSFWTGMVALAFRHTGDPRYKEYLYTYLPQYQERLRSGYTDHDLGFLYQLYAVEAFRLTGDEVFRSLGLAAADMLLLRYNERGQFIRAWGPLSSDIRSGKIIIDCMMNLPLLHSASLLTGEDKYRQAACAHAESSRAHLIRPDYTTYHTFDFDPVTGKPIGGCREDGYSDESTWSRGQAWGIYGFTLAAKHTGEEKFLITAQGMADFFMAHTPEGKIPPWDFRLPDDAPQLLDTSAAAIAISGMLDLAEAVTDSKQAKRYREWALQALQTLQECASARERTQGILPCSYARTDQGAAHHYTIWGDYYYLEALGKAAGCNWQLWTL